MERDELAAWLRLTLADGIGNITVRKLLRTFGPPENVLAQSNSALAQVLGERQIAALRRADEALDAQIERTWAWLAQDEARGVVALGDAHYPATLLEIEDPPPLLYWLGSAPVSAVTRERSIAIVGSRNPTPQGLANARHFARALSGAGLTIVSGLALGVDGAAHEGALEGAPGDLACATVAVLGTGLDRIYPKTHHALAHRIAERGLLLSEWPIGTPPLAENFPRRNRIIAGLTQGTLVVEAALRSGSLITARCAAEQGREVFAIPGSIHSPQSRGCHALIKQGARLVEDARDVLEELRLPAAPAAAHAAPSADAPDSLLELMGHDPVGFDALQARCGLPTPALQAALLEHELAGRVARLPGGLLQRVVTA